MTKVSAELLAKLHGLLGQALELEHEEREAWLETVRAADPDHAAELERLLAREAELDASRFLA